MLLFYIDYDVTFKLEYVESKKEINNCKTLISYIEIHRTQTLNLNPHTFLL